MVFSKQLIQILRLHVLISLIRRNAQTRVVSANTYIHRYELKGKYVISFYLIKSNIYSYYMCGIKRIHVGKIGHILNRFTYIRMYILISLLHQKLFLINIIRTCIRVRMYHFLNQFHWFLFQDIMCMIICTYVQR